MGDLTYSRTFRCTPAALWPWLTESDKIVRWMKGVEEHRFAEPPPHGRGAKFSMKIKEGGKLSDYAGELLDVEPRRRLRLKLVGGCGPRPMAMEIEYRLSDLGRETQVDYACRMELPPGCLWAILGWIGSKVARAMAKRFFAKLATLVEAA